MMVIVVLSASGLMFALTAPVSWIVTGSLPSTKWSCTTSI